MIRSNRKMYCQGALKSLFAVSESYPELKANENFNKLQDQLQRLEEEIAGSRRYYNGVVNRYNTKTELFPGNIIAGIFGFKRNHYLKFRMNLSVRMYK